MPNFCAAPNCTRKSTQSDLAFFRFPRDPERCRLWVENCRRADLEEKTPDQLNKHYRLCAKHFEPAMICKTTDEEVRKIKERRLESSIEQLLSKKDKTTGEDDAEVEDVPQLTAHQKELREFLRSLFEVIVLIGRQNIPSSYQSKEEPANMSTFQALLENRINAGDEVLRGRFEAAAVNEEFFPGTQQKQLLDVCERCVRDELLQEVRESRFFSLVTGELVEFPEGQHIPVFLRFVDQSNTLREEFVEFLLFEGEEKSMADRLESHIMKEWDLNMEHCRGQAHSGSGVFGCKMKAIANQLMEKYPMAMNTPCATYALNTHLANSVSLTGVQVVMSVLKKTDAFFKASPLLQAELDSAICILSQGNTDKGDKLKENCRATWTELHDVFEMVVELLEPLLLCMDSIHDNEDLKWNDQITNDAYAISEALADFEFVVTLVVMKNALSFTRAFGKNLQGETLDVYFAASSLTAVLHSLHEVLDNIEVYHEFWFEEAVNLATSMEIPVKVPRLFLRKQRAIEMVEIQAESFYKEYLTLPLMEHITQEVKDMFSDNHIRALKCLSLVPAVMGHMKFNTSEEAHADIFRSDLPQPDTLPAELHCWRIKWKHRGKEVNLPCTIHETLQHSDVKFFPNVNAFLRILASFPVLTFGGQGGSGQKRLQAYLSDTPVRHRSKSLAVLNINYHIKIDLDEMIECYIKSYPEEESPNK
ncbi:THAP domain containing 12b isoform X2 [Tachysurus fulvidraco]|uniref:THAP domain containing 12b isoform X2 n=1 Tax=Tachysurus fulvidraco TaxID=1234273 RepID=UPI001FEFC6FC|nr:THAP domain containing 12b isoform X2 [Tachysurus fulvidraco]